MAPRPYKRHRTAAAAPTTGAHDREAWRRVYEFEPSRTPFAGWERRELTELGDACVGRTDECWEATRHARAAVGGRVPVWKIPRRASRLLFSGKLRLLAGVVVASDLYVSGGAELQVPPGGGSVGVVYEALVHGI